jgi:toxin-antitoxin system PIN domain toxin
LIAIDTNILVYAHRRDSPWHDAAVSCLKRLAEGADRWCIPWPCVHEFLAIVTHPLICNPPTPVDVAFMSIERIASAPSVVFVGEQPGHLMRLRDLAVPGKVAGPMVHDARVATICVSLHISELWSADRDFSRFPGLKVRNPLV